MATTPVRPRQSGIPTPGRSSIPTPGRPRSTSRAGQTVRVDAESEQMSRALSDAIRKNNPNRHRESDISTVSSTTNSYSLSPQSARLSTSGRRSVNSLARPGSVASTSSAISSGAPRTPVSRPKTPATSARQSFTRPQSRQSDVRSSSRLGLTKAFETGDAVRIESLGFEGVLKYIGDIAGKPGVWAGVELGGGFTGLGKNDGSVNGVQYFSCPPKCGVFVAVNKLSQPPQRRPPSVASHADGRSTPASSGRTTPAFLTPTARPRYSKVSSVAQPPPNNFSAGSRASKYANMTAERLRNATNTFNNTPPRLSIPSPTRLSPTRNLHSSPARGSPVKTPRPLAKPMGSSDSLSSHGSLDFVTPKAPNKTQAVVSNSPMTLRSPLPLSSPITRSLVSEDPPADIFSDLSSSSRSIERISPTTPFSDTTQLLQAEVNLLKSQVSSLESANARLALEASDHQEKLKSTSDTVQEYSQRIEALSSLEQRLPEVEAALLQRDTDLKEKTTLLEQTQQTLADIRDGAAATANKLMEELEKREEKIKALDGQVDELSIELSSERTMLMRQVEELRSAGQETIALYEDRLSANEARRYELEDAVTALQDKVTALTRPLSPATMARHASEAAQIDNETLREHAAHLQKRITSLEEMLDDTKAAAEKEEEAVRVRLDKYRESELTLRKEIETWKVRVDEGRRAESKGKTRIEELEDALKENVNALENTRAEVETLRSELAMWQSSQDRENVGPGVESSAVEATTVQHEAEVARLHGLLEAAHVAEEELSTQVDVLRLEVSKSEEAAAQSRAAVATFEKSDLELRNDKLEAEEKIQLLNQLLEELQMSVNDQQVQIEKLRESSSREASASQSSERDTRATRHDLAEKREEIAGLKLIVQQLSQENAAVISQMKIIEAERNLLVSETAQLREELKALEENLERSFLGKEPSPDNLSLTAHSAMSTPPHSRTAEHPESMELRRKVAELEQKHARVVHDLNKEISELETLVESKIYREDELERELERYREKANRAAKKASKESSEASFNMASSKVNTGDACEICGQPGHDIFSCPILKDENPKPSLPTGRSLWCEDCESHGHVAADCPHSMDVF